MPELPGNLGESLGEIDTSQDSQENPLESGHLTRRGLLELVARAGATIAAAEQLTDNPYSNTIHPGYALEQDQPKEFAFPWGENYLEALRKAKAKPEVIENTSNILFEFVEQEINNSRIFTSEKSGLAFPYTSINVGELAKKLYAKYASPSTKARQPQAADGAAANSRGATLEFTMSSFFAVAHGNQFAFVERAIHQVMKFLPAALADVQNGREPKNIQIYTLGSPTNEFGRIPQTMAEAMENDPFKEIGQVYAELIESEAKQHHADENTNINIWGISMGANFSGKAAEKLLNDQVVSQEVQNQNNRLPKLQIHAEVPAGMNSSGEIQIPLGFIGEAAFETGINPAVKHNTAGDAKFTQSITPRLAELGIVPHMDQPQQELKSKIILKVLNDLRKGVTLSPKVKVTTVEGLGDFLSTSESLIKSAIKQTRKAGHSLGRNAVPSTNPNVRRRFRGGTHMPPFYSNENEIRRVKRTANALKRVRQG